jgi:hypothetical protein
MDYQQPQPEGTTKSLQDWETLRNAGVYLESRAGELFDSLENMVRSHRRNLRMMGECSGRGYHNQHDYCNYCDADRLLSELNQSRRIVQHGPGWSN